MTRDPVPPGHGEDAPATTEPYCACGRPLDFALRELADRCECGRIVDETLDRLGLPNRSGAARRAARRLYGDDECEVDDDARVTHLEEPDTGVEGYAWVQCWRLVPADAIDGEL